MNYKKSLIISLLLIFLIAIPVSFASAADIDSIQLSDNNLIINQDLDGEINSDSILNENIISDSNSNQLEDDYNENIGESDNEDDGNSQYEVSSIESTSNSKNLLSDSSKSNLLNLDTGFSEIEFDFSDENTIFVNSSYIGEEEDGTQLKPFKSILDGFALFNDWSNNKANIFLAEGTYDIPGSLSVSKSLNLIGENPANTIISGFNNSVLLRISNSNTLVNIVNLTLTNGLNTQGGAIYLSQSSLNIINSIFYNNRAYDVSSSTTGEGGVIYNDAGFVKIYNSTFLNNSIYGKYSKYGGVIYSKLGELSIFNSKFINNSIQGNYSTGGVIYNFNGFLTIYNSSILNTTLSSGYHSLGGAVSVWNGRNTYIIHSTISGNEINGKFVFGSAIAHKGVLLEIINSTISNNSANGTSVENSTVYNINGNCHIENTIFENNTVQNAKSDLLLCLEDQLIISSIADLDLLADLPSSYDLRELGLVTSVKNQGSNGDCWAFAIYSALESYLLKFENISYDFSENNMKNAMYINGLNGTEWENGGNHILAFAYLLRGSGPVNESLDPYSSSSSPEDLDIEKYITGFKYVPLRLNYLDNDQIKYAILQYGALYTSIFSRIFTGYNGYSNISTINNHAVAIVGWDDNYSASNFAGNPLGDGAWIIKNSWGSNSGQGGYYYVSYYDATFPGVTDQFAAIAITSVENLSEYRSIYQHDYIGNSFESLGYNSNTAWIANQFTAESSNPLKAFGLYTFGSSSYLVNVTVNGISKLVQEGDLIGAGYHTVKFDSLIDLIKGDIFKITVRLTTPDSIFPIAIESKRSDYSTKVTAALNQSFISPDGINWYDIAQNTTVTKFFEDVNRIKLVETNVCLKAYTEFADDLSLEIKSNSSLYLEGDIIEFNITIANNGDPSGEINITAALDEVVEIISYNINSGSFDPLTNVWTLDNLENGEFETLNLILRFNEYKAVVNTSVSANSVSYSSNKNISNFSIVNYASHTEFLEIPNVNTKVHSNESIAIALFDAYNKIMVNKNIVLSLLSSNNGISIEPITLNTNEGTINFNLDLLAGSYRFMVSFDGDNRYDSCNTTFDVTAVKTATQVTASNLNATVVVASIDGKVGKYLKMTLKDKDGNLLAGKKVTFIYNNKTATKVTDKNGVASLQINMANAGTYSFKISFSGDENYTGSSKTVKVVLKKQSLKLTAPNRTYKLKAKSKLLTATLKNSKGKLIANKKLTITVNGKKYTAKTNSKGIVKIKVSLSKRKTYKFTVKFAGDKSYNAVSRTAKLVIK